MFLHPWLIPLLSFFAMITSSSHSLHFDYGQALSKSLLYFESQRSGHLPHNQRATWRHHSALNDGLEQGGVVVVIVTHTQNKTLLGQVRDDNEKMAAENKTLEAQATEAKLEAAIAREKARESEATDGCLGAQVRQLKKDLVAARVEHERHITKVLPAALEKAHADVVEEFKDSAEYLAECAKGMKDLKDQLLKHNPSAVDLDWSFMDTPKGSRD